jgi:hypothetical protein
MISGIFWWNMDPDGQDEITVDFRIPKMLWMVDLEAFGEGDPAPHSDWIFPTDASALISQLLDSLPEGEWDVNVWWSLKDGKVRMSVTASPPTMSVLLPLEKCPFVM